MANTAANRRMTIGVSGRDGVLRHQSGSLWLVHTGVPTPSRPVEVIVLVLANAIATVCRFLALRQLLQT